MKAELLPALVPMAGNRFWPDQARTMQHKKPGGLEKRCAKPTHQRGVDEQFRNFDLGTEARVAVELDLTSGKALLEQLRRAIDAAEKSGLDAPALAT